VNSDIARIMFRRESNYGCIAGQGLGPQHSEEDLPVLIERGRQQNAKLVVVSRNLRALKQTLLLSFFKAEKSIGGHVKKSITLLFFNRIRFCLAARCRTFQEINL